MMISERSVDLLGAKRIAGWSRGSDDADDYKSVSLRTAPTAIPQSPPLYDLQPEDVQILSLPTAPAENPAYTDDLSQNEHHVAAVHAFNVQDQHQSPLEPSCADEPTYKSEKRAVLAGRRERGPTDRNQRVVNHPRDSSTPTPTRRRPSPPIESPTSPEQHIDHRAIYAPSLCQAPLRIEPPERLEPIPSPSSPGRSECDSGISVGSSIICALSPSNQTSRQADKYRSSTNTTGTTGQGEERCDDKCPDAPRRPLKRPNPDEGFAEEDDASAGRKNTKKENQRSFACPFYKRDPIRHGQCVRFDLKRIKDVKQHLSRNHSPPYCARCWRTFADDNLRDQHARELPTCEKRDQIPEDWCTLTGEQRARLNKRQSRGVTPEKHWYQVWDIVCPGITRPSSPYQLSQVQETISRVRTLWERQRDGIVSSVMRTRLDIPNDAEGVIANMMDEVLVRFEQESRATTQREGEARPPSPPSPPPSRDPLTSALSWGQQSSSYADEAVFSVGAANDESWYWMFGLNSMDAGTFSFGESYPPTIDESSFEP